VTTNLKSREGSVEAFDKLVFLCSNYEEVRSDVNIRASEENT
jgi:hypothetical protein